MVCIALSLLVRAQCTLQRHMHAESRLRARDSSMSVIAGSAAAAAGS
jgi:hypothetical protein